MPRGKYKRTDEARKNMSNSKKEWWNNPDNKDEIEKERKRRSEYTRNWWKDIENNKEAIDKIRRKITEGRKKFWSEPKNRKRMSVMAKNRYRKFDKKPSDYARLHSDLIKEIEYQYDGGCSYRDIVGLLGINQHTARKYIKMIKD